MAGQFSEVLRRLREQAGLTQEELAARAGVAVRTIGRLETGERSNPQVGTVRRLADALNTTPEERAQLLAAADGQDSPGVNERSGEYTAARELHQDTRHRQQQVMGEEHPETLRSANHLAENLANLGELDAARDLHRDTWRRQLRVLGEDHPDTRLSAKNLRALKAL